VRLFGRPALLSLVITACIAARPPAAPALPLGPICKATGLVNGLAGKACGVVQKVTSVTGGGSGGRSPASTAIELAAIGAWAVGGATVALRETAKVLGETTSPQLETTWFSGTYWRMAGIGALLTLPFLFAAAVQALMQSDLTLLARAALGYLPLSLLSVAIAAPLTTLLLAASDQMSAIVSGAAGNAGGRFLGRVSGVAGAIGLIKGSPFLVFLVALLTAAAAIVLWVELLMREAAVYIVVLMLPLAFAALVWPARRIWAVRAIELLAALILSKFAIVAVLSLGGAALDHSVSPISVTGALAGLVVVTLGAFAPWALLRLLPMAELASGAAGSLRGELWRHRELGPQVVGHAYAGEHWAQTATAHMRREVDELAAAPATNGASGAKPAAPTTPVGAAASERPTEPLPDLPILKRPDNTLTLDFTDGVPPPPEEP
jgi:hypothetical protein